MTNAVKKFDRLTLDGLRGLRRFRYGILSKMIRIDVPFPAVMEQLRLCRDVERRIRRR